MSVFLSLIGKRSGRIVLGTILGLVVSTVTLSMPCWANITPTAKAKSRNGAIFMVYEVDEETFTPSNEEGAKPQGV
ncbi:MAG: hypothetical protein PVH19_14965, partial [Planctomycetia bacterium]